MVSVHTEVGKVTCVESAADVFGGERSGSGAVEGGELTVKLFHFQVP